MKVACPKGEPLDDGSAQLKEYKYQYKRLCTHLRRNSNLMERVKKGELAGEELASLQDNALMGEAQRSELEQFKKEGMHDALGLAAEDSAHWTPSPDYTCPRCESNDCIYLEMFTGLDHGDDNHHEATLTIRCRECKHLWKEDGEDGGRMAVGGFGQGASAASSGQPSARGSGAGDSASGAAKPTTAAPEIWNKRTAEPTWMLPA